MADPRVELADIIVPLAPAAATQAGGTAAWFALAAGLALLVLTGGALVRWRRRRFVRSLDGICRAANRQQGGVALLAGLLDVWARGRYRRAWLDAAQPPQSVDAATWAQWVEALAALRFAPVSETSRDTLARLCAGARQWPPHD